jgi:hypothetical protein
MRIAITLLPAVQAYFDIAGIFPDLRAVREIDLPSHRFSLWRHSMKKQYGWNCDDWRKEVYVVPYPPSENDEMFPVWVLHHLGPQGPPYGPSSHSPKFDKFVLQDARAADISTDDAALKMLMPAKETKAVEERAFTSGEQAAETSQDGDTLSGPSNGDTLSGPSNPEPEWSMDPHDIPAPLSLSVPGGMNVLRALRAQECHRHNRIRSHSMLHLLAGVATSRRELSNPGTEDEFYDLYDALTVAEHGSDVYHPHHHLFWSDALSFLRQAQPDSWGGWGQPPSEDTGESFLQRERRRRELRFRHWLAWRPQ